MIEVIAEWDATKASTEPEMTLSADVEGTTILLDGNEVSFIKGGQALTIDDIELTNGNTVLGS